MEWWEIQNSKKKCQYYVYNNNILLKCLKKSIPEKLNDFILSRLKSKTINFPAKDDYFEEGKIFEFLINN